MIETNLTGAESELREVINLFPESESAHIKHVFKDGADRLINTVTVDGGAYVYGNLIPAGLTPLIKKRLIKRYAKLSVYKALSKKYGKDLPWGALTGIRPTALAYSEMDKGGRFEEFFTEVMKVSPAKTALTRAVIEAQRGVYEKNPDNTDFFVFIPFCPSRCRYCSFVTADMARYAPLANDYAETLAREIEASAPLVKKLRSIYIGGGTPVALSDGQLEKVLTALDKINAGVEYTAEAGRPDRITKENLSILKAHGVTRVCVNPQTFSDETLKRIGRNHTAAEAEEKFLLAKSMGFSVNMDFIAGLEGETEEDFLETLDVVKKVRYDSAYTFLYSKRTGTPAAMMENQVPEEVAKERFDRLLRVVSEISSELVAEDTGRIEEVLVEERGVVFGRVAGIVECCIGIEIEKNYFEAAVKRIDGVEKKND